MVEPEGTESFNPKAVKELEKNGEWRYDPIEKVEELSAPFTPSLSSSVSLKSTLLRESWAEKLLTPQDKVEAQAYASLGRRFRPEMPWGKSKIEVENDGGKDSLLLSLCFQARQEAEVLLIFEGKGKGVYFLEVDAGEESKVTITVI